MQKTGKRPAQCGINLLRPRGVEIRGMNYRDSPHHTTMKNIAILG